jgi:Ca2+-binding RTX toxin-like protein
MAIFSTNGHPVDFSQFNALAALDLTANYFDVSDAGFTTSISGGLFTTTVEVLGTFQTSGNTVTSGTISNLIITEEISGAVYSFSLLGADYEALLQTSPAGRLAFLLSGSDLLTGSDHADTLYGYGDADVIDAGGGDDIVSGGAGNDKIHGGSDADTLYGGGDNDEVYGEAGSDSLYGGTGYNKLFGGGGNDKLFGFTESDYLYGGAGKDRLQGDDGNDQLHGGGGKDILLGGEGGDSLDGGAGVDKIDGGGGFDTIDYTSASKGLVLTLKGANFAKAKLGGKLADKVKNVESVYGTAHKDIITGDGGNNGFLGGNGNDVLKGKGGSDSFFGGNGNDKLTGGGGADHFWFITPPGQGKNVDTITDFEVGVDKIHLGAGQFSVLSSSPGSSSVADNFVIGHPHDHNDYFIYKPGSGKLIYDSNGNGNGGGVVFAILDKHLDLTAADFTF